MKNVHFLENVPPAYDAESQEWKYPFWTGHVVVHVSYSDAFDFQVSKTVGNRVKYAVFGYGTRNLQQNHKPEASDFESAQKLQTGLRDWWSSLKVTRKKQANDIFTCIHQ